MALSRALSKNKVATTDWAPIFPPLRREKCYVLYLDAEGKVADVHIIGKEDALLLHHYGSTSSGFFPGFNLQALYRIPFQDKEDGKKELDSWLSGKCPIDLLRLSALYNKYKGKAFHPSKKKDAYLYSCLNRIASELKELIPDTIQGNKTLSALFKRTEKTRIINIDTKRTILEDSLEQFVWKRIMKKQQDAYKLLPLLVRSGSAKYNDDVEILSKDDDGKVLVYLDVTGEFESQVATAKMSALINQALLQSNKKGDKTEISSEEADSQDAFGDGFQNEEESESFPGVSTQSALSKVILRTQKADKECQRRYSKIDGAAYYLSKSNKADCKRALEWIAALDNKGKTWAPVGNGEILFAYPEILPKTIPFLARALGEGADAGNERFLDCAETVFDSIRDTDATLKLEPSLRLFGLKKADKARRKVDYQRDVLIKDIKAAIEQWREGVDNLPQITMLVWPQRKGDEKKLAKGTRPVLLAIYAPYPLSVIDVAYTKWTRSLKSSLIIDKKGHIPIFDGFDLFFSPVHIDTAKRLLGMVVQNSSQLLMCVGNLSHCNQRHFNTILETKLACDFGRVLATIGIILSKLGIRKEQFMHEPAYLIGRILRVSDDLHALYCEIVRDGSKLPTQLLGNAVFSAALDNPMQALAILAKRIMPYLAWARTNSTGKAGLSRWFLKQYADIVKELDGKPLPSHLTDVEKTQLFLGYLSGNEKKAEVSSVDDVTEQKTTTSEGK